MQGNYIFGKFKCLVTACEDMNVTSRKYLSQHISNLDLKFLKNIKSLKSLKT